MEDLTSEQKNKKMQLSARNISPLTLVGATTYASGLNRKFTDKFGLQFELQHCSEQERSELLTRFAQRNKINVTPNAIKEIAKRSKGVANEAVHYLELCNEFAVVFNHGKITTTIDRTGNYVPLHRIKRFVLATSCDFDMMKLSNLDKGWVE